MITKRTITQRALMLKESGETEMKKDKEWAKRQVADREFNSDGGELHLDVIRTAHVYKILNQLDEPEVLSQEITEEQAYDKIAETFPATEKEIKSVLEKYYSGMFIEFSEELQESIMRAFDVEATSKTIEALTGMTLEQIAEEAINGGIVPKQEEVDRAYKDGYEKRKQHTFYKGYLKGIADKESINPERSPEVDRHKELLDELNDLYARKNQDYGNSFDESLDEDGLLVLKIRLGDKYKRFNTLINQKNEVVDESMRDTLIDLANYALMGVMWMDKNEEEE